ncbi:MAG TPA: hypothetical protein DEF88_06780 [Porphyromonadaceae bacterium]|nr:hypothetical protein [Porphyromonadaceae bacterium]
MGFSFNSIQNLFKFISRFKKICFLKAKNTLMTTFRKEFKSFLTNKGKKISAKYKGYEQNNAPACPFFFTQSPFSHLRFEQAFHTR